MARPSETTRPNAAVAASDDPRYTAAEFPPNKLLYLMQLAEARGVESGPGSPGSH